MRDNLIKIADLIYQDRQLWIADAEMGIVEIDRLTKKKLIPYRDSDIEYQPYSKSVLWGDCIFLIPYASDSIMVYKISDNKSRMIPVKDCNCLFKGNSNEKFMAYGLYGNYLYAFPWRYPVILRINMETCEVTELISWREGFEAYISNPSLTFFRNDIVCEGEEAYLVTLQAPVIFKFNMKTLEYEYIEVNKSQSGFRTICKLGTDFYVVNYENDLFIFDEFTKNVKKICDRGEWKREKDFLKWSFAFRSYLWFVPRYSCKLYYWDVHNGKGGEVLITNQDDEISYTKILSDREILIQTLSGNKYVYKADEDVVVSVNMAEEEIIEEYRKHILQSNLWQGKATYEGKAFLTDVPTLLNMLDNELRCDLPEEKVETAGDKIYKFLRQMT